MSAPLWKTLFPAAICIAAGGLILDCVISPDRPIRLPEPEKPVPTTPQNRTYEKTAVGIISGRGSKKDWGVKATTNFKYLYTIKGTSTVIQNDGDVVCEECTFNQCTENVFLGDVKLRIEIPDELIDLSEFLLPITEKIGIVATGGTAVAAGVGGTAVAVSGASASAAVARAALAGCSTMSAFLPVLTPAAVVGGGSYILKKMDGVEVMIKEETLKKFGLEEWTKGKLNIVVSNRENPLFKGGKKVLITYHKREGITDIKPKDCELSAEEESLIRRANSAMDYYVFPAEGYRKDSWTVPASAFTYLLDPYMHVSAEQVSGEVVLKQSADQAKDEHCVKIEGGTLSFGQKDEKKKAHGRVYALTGNSVFSDKEGIVTSAYMKGSVEYWDCSEDHLLFEVKHEIEPTFEMKYTCKPVEDK